MSLRGLVSGREELLTVGLVTTRSWARGKVRVCVKSRIVRVAARGRLAVSLYLQSICADDECCCYLFWVSRGEVIKSVVPQFPGRHYSYPPHPHYPGPSHHLIDTLVGGRRPRTLGSHTHQLWGNYQLVVCRCPSNSNKLALKVNHTLLLKAWIFSLQFSVFSL